MKIQDDIIQEIKNIEKMFPGIFFEYFEENSANLHYIFVSDKNIFENEEFAKLEAKVITRLETYEDSIISFLDKTMKNEIYSFNEFVEIYSSAIPFYIPSIDFIEKYNQKIDTNKAKVNKKVNKKKISIE